MTRLLAIVLVLLSIAAAFGVQPDEVLDNPVLEARARALSAGLRCMVCQNQSIDDSDAPLARDLRIIVRERLTAGDSDQMVIDYLVARYGAFVLLKPQFNPHTYLLWLAPLLLFVLGAIATLVFMRRRKAGDAVELDERERQRVRDLLAKEP